MYVRAKAKWMTNEEVLKMAGAKRVRINWRQLLFLGHCKGPTRWYGGGLWGGEKKDSSAISDERRDSSANCEKWKVYRGINLFVPLPEKKKRFVSIWFRRKTKVCTGKKKSPPTRQLWLVQKWQNNVIKHSHQKSQNKFAFQSIEWEQA